MKKYLFILLALITSSVWAQSKSKPVGITFDGHFQQYNGNLGNSFFKYKSTCFGGFSSTLGLYLSKSVDLNIIAGIGHFGYCQTNMDATRMVSLEQRCPGCTDRLGMGELRSLLLSGMVAVRYKLANQLLIKENAKLAPYVYGGLGINQLIDNMKRNCVNEGTHFTLNAGAGLKYNLNQSIFVGYNIALGCFMFNKVYLTNELASVEDQQDPIDVKLEKRKDLILQNGIFLGFNF